MKFTGTGGEPQEMMDPAFWSIGPSLRRPVGNTVLRLRGKRSAFVAGQEIGSVQFDLRIPAPSCASYVLRGRPSSEAEEQAESSS